MNNLCPESIRCPGTDFPVTNYSSEGGEPILPYLGVVWPPPPPPPPGSGFWATGCIGDCLSYTSQQEADECAQLQAALCNIGPNDGGGGGGTTPITPYYSGEASCTVNCSNGTAFTYYVNAGLFVALTQAQANAIAQAYACEKAQESLVCLGDLQRCWCLGDNRTSTIVPSGGVVVAWVVVSGSLPPGLVFSGGVVSGIPTTGGTYSITIRGYLANGSYAQRTYVLTALNITQTTLPNGTEGANYDQQLTVTGGTAPYTFTLIGGGFPLGVDITSSGLITGVVGEVGVFAPVIQVTDVTGCICSRVFSLTTAAAGPTVCAYFTLDEASGNRYDSVTNLEWTYADAPGTGSGWIGSTPGLYSNAVRCYTAAAGSSVAQLNAINQAQLATTGNGWSLCGWFKRVSANVGGVSLVWRNDFMAGYWSATLLFSAGVNQVRILDADVVTQSLNFAATTGDWHFFHISLSPVDQRIYFQIDNGAAVSMTNPSNVPAGDTGDIHIYAADSCSEILFDEVAFKCDQPLTADELTYLYNSGLGRTWPLT